MNDTISRQAAITALTFAKETGNMKCGELKGVIEVLNRLPSAEPKRMRATWISKVALQEGQITWRDYKCSNCSHHRGKPMNFCEVCGAKMER